MQKPTKWKHNFSAGPSVVDPGVLAKLSAELASFEDTGMVRARVPRALARFARRTHRDASRDTRRIPPRAPLVTFRRPNRRLATTPPV
jgi:phosphoserine aminotransferase